MLYTENSETSTMTLLELINESRKVSGYTINIQKAIVFLYASSEQSEREIKKKNPIYSSIEKNKIIRKKLIKEIQNLYSEDVYMGY